MLITFFPGLMYSSFYNRAYDQMESKGSFLQMLIHIFLGGNE